MQTEKAILKIGDIVMAKYDTGRYKITRDGWKGEVTTVHSSNFFDAIGINGCQTDNGMPFEDLDLDYFYIYRFCEN